MEGEHPDLARLKELEEESARAGGPGIQRRQKRLGKLLVRERVARLCDHGSFTELGRFFSRPRGVAPGDDQVWGDGVVTGTGRIDGRRVVIYAHDPTVYRGSVGLAGAQKVLRALRLAEERQLPVVGLLDSDGARVSAGSDVVPTVAELLTQVARLSGRVPHITVVLGFCGGATAYTAALSDLVVAHETHGYLFVTGAKVTQVVTGQSPTLRDLGGVAMHAGETGLVHVNLDSEEACLEAARKAVGYLSPSSSVPGEPQASDPEHSADRPTDEILEILPDSPRKGYDIRRIIGTVFDQGTFLELQEAYGTGLVVGLAELARRPVGIVASQPLSYAGSLDSDSSRKGARLVQMCGAYGLPVVTLADVPGFRPGVKEEQEGLLLHGAKLISAYANCPSPVVTLILRKSYGGGNVLAAAGQIKLAYPFARIQPMGAEAALQVVSHRTFGEPSEEEMEEVKAHYRALDQVHVAAEAGAVDRVIHPSDTRRELIEALTTLAGPNSHGNGEAVQRPNIPL